MSNRGKADWGNKPLVVVIGVVSSLIAILAFITGRQSLTELVGGRPTSVPKESVRATLTPVEDNGAGLDVTPTSAYRPSATATSTRAPTAHPIATPEGRILVTEDDTIFSVNVSGDEVEQVERGTAAVLSPSGEKIAFVRGNYLRVGPLFGEHPVVLELGPESSLDTAMRRFISWSPDETSLLIRMAPVNQSGVRSRPDSVAVFEIESQELTEIIPPDEGWGIIAWAAWDPSGSRIAYLIGGNQFGIAGRSLLEGRIMVLDVNSGRTTELDTAFGSSFAWSPDGEWIAYFAKSGELSMMRPDGSNAKWVVDQDGLPLIAYHGEHVTWSPDGNNLLCVLEGDYLWIVDLQNSSMAQIGELKFKWILTPPSWAPWTE